MRFYRKGKFMKMNSIMAAAVSATIVALAGVSAAEAQNWQANPNYGSVSLRTGFTPDPYVVNVMSGGTINAAGIGGVPTPPYVSTIRAPVCMTSGSARMAMPAISPVRSIFPSFTASKSDALSDDRVRGYGSPARYQILHNSGLGG